MMQNDDSEGTMSLNFVCLEDGDKILTTTTPTNTLVDTFTEWTKGTPNTSNNSARNILSSALSSKYLLSFVRLYPMLENSDII